MPAAYKRFEYPAGTLVGYRRDSDQAIIPIHEANTDWQDVKAWLAAGNVADPADPIPTPAPPPALDYGGNDVSDGYYAQLQAAVDALVAYVNLPAPSAAQTTAAVKLLARMMLFVVRKVLR